MIRALYTSATGMNAQETNIDVIANNLANVNTTGFKKSRADFQDLIYQTIVEPGAQTSAGGSQTPSGIQIGLGVRNSAVQRLFEQGDLANTGNQLDVAIQGEGFFRVQVPGAAQDAFTRAGNFQLNENGELVTSDGYVVQPTITVGQDVLSITITEDGTVNARVQGQTTLSNLGQIEAVRFPNPSGLRALGRNLFEESDASGTAISGNFATDGVGRLQQGFLESSNVSVVEQVVNMITAQRAYEAASKGIQTADEMVGQAIQLKR